MNTSENDTLGVWLSPKAVTGISVKPLKNTQEQNLLMEGSVRKIQMPDACMDYHTYQLGMNTSNSTSTW